MGQVFVTSLGSLLAVASLVRLTAWARGWRRIDLTIATWLGLISFLAVHVLLEAYRVAADVRHQIVLWQLALVLCGVMYAALLSLISKRPSYQQPMVAALAIVSVFLLFTPWDQPAGQKTGEFALSVVIFALCIECYIRIPREDVLARSVWVLTTVANAFTAIQILDCQLLHEIHAPREAGSKCSQIYGPVISWFPSVGTIAMLLFVLVKHDRMESR